MLTHALVERLVVEEGRVVAVDVLRHGTLPERVHARREVILAAGAIGSPQILQLSGIGPGWLLQDRGIPVVHELPGVGENLQDHLQIRPVFRVHGCVTLNDLANRLTGRMRMALEYLLRRTGPLTMAPSTLGAFAKSDPSLETPNLEYHVQPLSLDRFGAPLHRFSAITPSVCNLRPTSRGWVRIRSPEPREQPEIRPNYLSTPEDRRVAADALRLTRRIMAARALARYRPEEYRPGAEITGEEELADAAGRIGTTIFHPVGTCRMGPADDRTTVVDHRLRLHGLRGLRVVDASIMPTITSGNTASPVVMIAEKAADMIREDARAG
ncbi:Oxygen-dependent choline dehydrogenase [bacterium HR39]|nr:Oxygen-dependent choline dehydrogenase [bacterium HR39]